jgi:ribosome biogenesis GTPase / thiamine phosphate phosphatase
MISPSRSTPPDPATPSGDEGARPDGRPGAEAGAALLRRFGWDDDLEQYRQEACRPDDVPGRVTAEHRGEYSVLTPYGEMRGEIAGRLRLGVQRGEDLRPAVGDWVLLTALPDADRVIIHCVLPRRTKLSRKAAGREDVEQVIAANIDLVFVVSSLDHDLNKRRLERYLSVVGESGARPAVVLTKTDLCGDVRAARHLVERVAPGAEVHAVSAVTGEGMDELAGILSPGLTVALIGSSGVGKSTLVNHWLGEERQAVQEVREDGKGRHTTTFRELLPLPSGALMIDTPGMRELAVWTDDEEQAEQGLAEAFSDIEALASRCRFNDCRHESEPGCAVLLAVEQGEVDRGRVASYRKLRAEAEAAEMRASKRAKAEGKKADKRLGRSIKAFYREQKQRPR